MANYMMKNSGQDLDDAVTAYKNGTIAKSKVGLGNVDNTSDADKPISTATQKELDSKADKFAINDTGIKSVEYESLYSFNVTTDASDDYISPYARVSDITGRLSKLYTYRITCNDTIYELPGELYVSATISGTSSVWKVNEYVGNISLYSNDTAAIGNKIRTDIPFCIIFDLNGSNSIDVFTTTASSYNFTIERKIIDYDELPKELIYGSAYSPFEFKNSETSTYSGISIGSNMLTNSRGTVAIGTGNKCSADFSFAIGNGNLASGVNSFAKGNSTTASGYAASTEGGLTVASGKISHAEGQLTVASGNVSHVEGNKNKNESHFSHVEGTGNILGANGHGVHVQGINNLDTNEQSGETVSVSWTNADGTVHTSSFIPGKYIHVIGNGKSNDNRSNAHTLDWNGNAWYQGTGTFEGGSITIGQTTLTEEHIKSLLGLLSGS